MFTLHYQTELVAEFANAPLSIEYATVFGVPVFIVIGDKPETLGDGFEIEKEGIRTLNLPEPEDSENFMIWLEKKPEHPTED